MLLGVGSRPPPPSRKVGVPAQVKQGIVQIFELAC